MVVSGHVVAGLLLFTVFLQHTVTGVLAGVNDEHVKQTARKPRVRNLSPHPAGVAPPVAPQGGSRPQPSVGQQPVGVPLPVVSRPRPQPSRPRKTRIRELVPPFRPPVAVVPPGRLPPGGAPPPTVGQSPAPLQLILAYQNPNLYPIPAPAPRPVPAQPHPAYPHQSYPSIRPIRAKRDTKPSEDIEEKSYTKPSEDIGEKRDKSSEEINQILENILSAPLATKDDTKDKTLLEPQNLDEFAPPDDLSSTPVPPVRLPIAVATFPPGMSRPKPVQPTAGPPMGRVMNVRRSHGMGIQGPPRTAVAPGVRQVWTPDNLPTLQPRWCGGTTFEKANVECLSWEFCMMAPGTQEGYCKRKCCLADSECGYPGAVCVGAQPNDTHDDHSILGLCYGPPAHPGNDVSRDHHHATNNSQ